FLHDASLAKAGPARRELHELDRDAVGILEIAGLAARVRPPRDLDRLDALDAALASQALEVGVEIVDDEAQMAVTGVLGPHVDDTRGRLEVFDQLERRAPRQIPEGALDLRAR